MQHVNRECIIEFQAFRDNHDKFIIKELVVLDLTTNISYSFLFQPPYPFNTCNSKSSRTNNWLSNHYHHINWNDGYINYNECEGLVKKFCNKFDVIFTTGSEKAKWISKRTNTLVFELRFPKEYLNNNHLFPVCQNVENARHKTSNCSLAKVYKLSLQLKQYPMLEEEEGVRSNGGGSGYLNEDVGAATSVQL